MAASGNRSENSFNGVDMACEGPSGVVVKPVGNNPQRERLGL
jgi:hypothetical protein